jgi:hypothetical protein
MALMELAPFGSVCSGAIAGHVGLPITFVFGGIVVLVAALIFATRIPALRPMVMPIYARKGIIPEIATGLQNASALLRTERR